MPKTSAEPREYPTRGAAIIIAPMRSRRRTAAALRDRPRESLGLRALEPARSRGRRGPRAQRPHRKDPIVELLTERGREHEAAYLKHLRAQKLVVAEIRTAPGADSVETTLAAMRDGADVIYQAPLADERWHGRADFLRKIARPSDLGAGRTRSRTRSSRPRRAPARSFSSASTRACSSGCKAASRRKRTSLRRTITSSPRAIGSPTTRRITGS